MKATRFLGALAAALIGGAGAGPAYSQVTYSEDFTGASTTNSWYFFNGACLTASTSAASTSPGQLPGCTAIGSSYYNENLVGGQNGVSGSSQTLPDPTGSGALRFTNGAPGGYHQNGAIVSAAPFSTDAGLQISFKTITYRGDSGGGGGDGADGISFYLMDGAQPAGIGAWGGSLGYTCSNANPPYNGLVGGYLGLGIDEYGNFLNQGDNTATGYGYQWNRIGMRGAGNVSWSYLNANYAAYYPSSLNSSQQQSAVQATCSTGYLWNYSNPNAPTPVLTGGSTTPVTDYAVIPNAYSLVAGVQIANENAMSRGAATPILYQLKITQDGLLSLSYSVNGGALQGVIKNQSITAANGALPASFRFGFAGSTGGSTNIHEIMCFKATPADVSGSSASVNEKQAAKVEAGTQAYFAFYNPNNWTGSLTANNLIDTAGVVTVSAVANWDADCVLSGVAAIATCPATGVAGPTAAEAPTSRNILTWSGTAGIPFEWSSITAIQQATLDAGDTTPLNAKRLNFLRGDRSNEFKPNGSGIFRTRGDVLGDIVDSSPVWVGGPIAPYTATWHDKLYSSATPAENSGQTYLQFVTAAQTRQNVIYSGANDGLMHGFRAGSFDASGNFVATNNDGYEVLAYMPGAVLQAIHSNVTPAIDYPNTQYGHAFYVDSTPTTGDLFYKAAWHTWLVGGLGPGGSAIFALDVTDPTKDLESNAGTLVIGEWTPATITCSNVVNCGNNLGNTYGTPQIRRLHNGMWGVIFGNGYGSTSGDAGIYVMTVDPTSGSQTFYYLSTGKAGSNGIASVAPADLDGDHITDYVYAGDLLGNMWRFDLTGSTPSSWAAASAPLFTTPSGQPITTKPVIASSPVSGSAPRLMVGFGTGRKIPLTNNSPATFASGTQDLYGVWDWNMTAWNAAATTTYASLPATASGTGLTSPYTVAKSNLQQQTFTIHAVTNVRDGSGTPVCWQGSASCGSGNNKFGWYADLPGTSEQILYNPVLFRSAFLVDSTVPANNVLTSCSTSTDTGFTYAVSIVDGSVFTNAFPKYHNDSIAAGVPENATGTPNVVTTPEGTVALVYQTISGVPSAQQITLPSNTKAKRLTWVELR